MAQSFPLNGGTAIVKDLTLGDLKQMQRLIKGKDESEYPTIMIGLCCGISEEEFDALPISSLKEVEAISDYIGGLIGG